MQKNLALYTVIAGIVFFQSMFSQQQWQWLNPLPNGNTIRGMQYIGTRYIWVSGNYGAAYRSTDGGTTWQWMDLGTGQISPAIFFVDTLNGWIGDYAGNILHTTNGGATWAIQASGLPTNITAMTFVNKQKGWAAASAAKVLMTTNGGTTWNAISTPALGSGSLSGISFVDSLHGWVSGTSQTIMNTTDGGNTWTLQPVTPVSPPPAIYDITFVDTLNGWAAGSNGLTYRTTNGGAAWTQVATSLAGVTYRKLSFANRNTGWACGAALGIVHTTDGGLTWQDQSPANMFNTAWAITAFDSMNAIIGGDYGLRFKTTNAGATWQQMSPGVYVSLYAVKARDSVNIWGVGSVGSSNTLVIFSSNGGTSWSTQSTTLATSIILRGVDATSRNSVWAVGTSGKIIHTTNAGSAWTEQTSGVTSALYGIAMADSANGYISGSSGAFLKTTNGGANWTATTVGSGSNYFVSSPGQGIVITGGSSGSLQKSTDGGTTWNALPVGTSATLYGISCLDQNSYWVCGSGGFISRTTNGGTTWTTQATPDSSNILGISVQPNGYAIASGGTLGASAAYSSTNFGTTWTSERTQAVVALQGVAFRDPANALVVGQGGAVELVRFSTRSIPPTVVTVSRNTRVPNAGDSLIVSARIIDSTGTGITADSLMYKLNGGTSVKAGMTRISGTNTDGIYSGVIPVSANANGNRVEYQVMAVNAAGTTTTAVAAANSYFAGITPMSPTGLRYEDSLYASPYKGYYARVSGTVNGPNWQAANLSTYIQDAVGGLNLYKSGALTAIRNLGDSVTVLGKLDQYRGVTEIVPDSLTDIVTVATGRTVTPIAVTVTQYNTTPELYESRLIKFTSLNRKYSTPVWPPAATAATIIMQQTGPSDTVTMYINAGTNIPGSTEPTYPVNMVCVGTQFASTGAGTQGGYEVLPRYVTDFTSNAPLSGNYTVGATGQFHTLDSAFAVLATVGVSGPVTLTLSDSVYAAPDRPAGTSVSRLASSRTAVLDDADPLSRNTTPNVTNGTDAPTTAGITVAGPIPGASATNRITVKPATGVKARISGTGSATFLFQNVSYVTFDGVGTTGTTQLTIENTATNGIAIALLGGCRSDVAKNLTIRSVYASGVGVYMDTASGAAPDSNTVMNNLIPSSQYGVYARGGNYIAHGNQILGNTIGSDSIGAVGVYNQQVAGSVIANNTIRNVKDAVAAGGNIAGIWVATKQLNMRVYNNVINGVKNRSTATAAVFAAGVYHFGTAGDTTRSKYYNNMVTGLDNPSTSTSATVRGMYLSTAIKDTAAYNSVYLTGTDGAAILSGALYMSSASVGLTLKDNIGINARIATGRAMAFYATGAPSSLVSNYNDLYVPTQTNSNVAAVGATNYATLAAWQATGQDSQSVNVMANFRTPDLHIDSTIATSIYGHGTPVAGVTTDIDGQVRNATTPCIGADEFLQGTPPPPGWSVQTSGVTNYLYSVKAVSQTVAWAAGAGGTVLKTVNSGQNWTSVGGGRIGTADIYNIDAVDGNTALVTTSPAATYIFRTTNGGTTWDTVYTLAGGFIDAIHMIDANNGIALGDPVSSKWTVAKTTNGGATWARITTEPAQVGGEAGTQNGLSMVGANNIWFNSGVGGRIYRSTDGGATWSSGVASFAATSNVWFTTALNGVATGSSASQVARSTDGGATWTTVTTSGSGFLIACAGSGTTDFWYAQGSVIYRSTNKGQTWTTSYTGVGTYVGLSFATTGGSTYGWAVSDSARIVAFNGTVTDVKDQQVTEVPTTFALQQNYPNPFNPTTTIRYGLPEASKVALSIYNVLGQKIATLTNDVQGAGFYNVVWNGHNDAGTQVASGIYFFRLEATPTGGGAPFSGMKKMVMLK